jgi:hypothetical protein
MFDGTFYLTGIDDKYKRFYAYKGLSNIPESGASIKSAKTSEVDFSGAAPTSSAVRLNAMKMQLLASSSSNEKEAKSGENNSSKKQQQQQ